MMARLPPHVPFRSRRGQCDERDDDDVTICSLSLFSGLVSFGRSESNLLHDSIFHKLNAKELNNSLKEK